MDWYHGSGLDELVVPKDQEMSDTLISPDVWSRWGITAPTPGKYFMVDGYFTVSTAAKGQLSESCAAASFCGKDQSNGSDVFGEPSDGSLADFNEIEHMDETFLNSILEDIPGDSSLPEPFCHSKLGSEATAEPSDDGLTNASLESQSISSRSKQSISSRSKQSVDSSLAPQAIGISPYVGFENGEASILPFSPWKSEQEWLEGQSLKDLVVSEENSSNMHVAHGRSLEESVLQEFQNVTAKLTDQTRMCFRDAFYRLAKSSGKKPLNQRTNANSSVNAPWTNQKGKIRSGGDERVEAYTNAIDRAIANLTFNNMDSNARDFPFVSASSSCQGGSRTTHLHNCYQRQVDYFPQHPSLTSFAEVPVFLKIGETQI